MTLSVSVAATQKVFRMRFQTEVPSQHNRSVWWDIKHQSRTNGPINAHQ